VAGASGFSVVRPKRCLGRFTARMHRAAGNAGGGRCAGLTDQGVVGVPETPGSHVGAGWGGGERLLGLGGRTRSGGKEDGGTLGEGSESGKAHGNG